MKNTLILLLILISFLPYRVLGKNYNENSTTKELTKIEAMSKKDKLTIIYICGGVILVGSCAVLIPIIKEKR